MATMKLVCN